MGNSSVLRLNCYCQLSDHCRIPTLTWAVLKGLAFQDILWLFIPKSIELYFSYWSFCLIHKFHACFFHFCFWTQPGYWLNEHSCWLISFNCICSLLHGGAWNPFRVGGGGVGGELAKQSVSFIIMTFVDSTIDYNYQHSLKNSWWVCTSKCIEFSHHKIFVLHVGWNSDTNF